MNKEIARIIDANINRSREGLRVCEEIARFILEDKTLSAEYKQLRHRISRLIKKFPGAHRGLAKARESQADVGRNIPDASRRKNYHDILLANMQRTKESLRVLEEFSAIFNRSLRTSFARVRFAVYRLEKRPLRDFRLYVILDGEVVQPKKMPAVAQAVVAGGAEVVQLRAKTWSDRQILNVGQQIKKYARRAGTAFLLNDRVDLALALDADGVHLGQEDLTVPEARALLGKDKLIGISTHSLNQARQAQANLAHYIAIGPLFATATKPKAAPLGTGIISAAGEFLARPWLAVGGITLENLTSVLKKGATRVAICRAILESRAITKTTKEFKRRLYADDSTRIR